MTKSDYLIHCGVTKKWHEKSFSDFDNDSLAKKEVLEYLKNHKSAFNKGIGLFLYGNNGVGKTLLLNLSFMQLIEKEYRVRIIALSDLVSLFMNAWYNDADLQALNYIKRVPFLGIEELNKEYKKFSKLSDDSTNSPAIQAIDSILRFRLQNCLPTWFTSNTQPADVKEHYTNDIVSMLNEMVYPILVKGEDKRKTFDLRKEIGL